MAVPSLGRQELDAELLEDLDGALWNRAMLDAGRVPLAPYNLARVVVAVDPSGGAGRNNDETGIVVIALGHDRAAYVLADLSGRYSPDGWARAAIGAYHDFEADRIVAEANFGGGMVEATIRAVDHNVPVRMVHASRGKAVRAEPVVAFYEQHRVHHVGNLPALEDQLCGWEPGISKGSPDRLDALVWGITELMVRARAAAAVFRMMGQTMQQHDEDDATDDLADLPTLPSAAELGIAVDGLPPQRERLVRFTAWQRQAGAALTELEQARVTYLDAMGVPALTEGRLRALIERDKADYLVWIKAGALKLTPAETQRFERERLEEKLAGDRHHAEIASAALAALEAEIEAARVLTAALPALHRGYLLDALIEHADAVAAEYLRRAEATREALLPLMALVAIVRDRAGYRGAQEGDHCSVALPAFGLPALRDGVAPGMAMVRPTGYIRPPHIIITSRAAEDAAAPWRDLMAAWTADPRAETAAVSRRVCGTAAVTDCREDAAGFDSLAEAVTAMAAASPDPGQPQPWRHISPPRRTRLAAPSPAAASRHRLRSERASNG